MNNIAKVVSMCGATLGQYILTVEQSPVDLGYSDKVTANLLRPSSPFYRYSIKPIRVESTRQEESANGITVVTFNDNKKLRLRVMTTDDIGKVIPAPNTKTVREAVERQKHDENDVTIFTDYIALTREITALNNETRQMMSAFIKELTTQMMVIEESNEAEKNACKAAMKELGITDINL